MKFFNIIKLVTLKTRSFDDKKNYHVNENFELCYQQTFMSVAFNCDFCTTSHTTCHKTKGISLQCHFVFNLFLSYSYVHFFSLFICSFFSLFTYLVYSFSQVFKYKLSLLCSTFISILKQLHPLKLYVCLEKPFFQHKYY